MKLLALVALISCVVSALSPAALGPGKPLVGAALWISVEGGEPQLADTFTVRRLHMSYGGVPGYFLAYFESPTDNDTALQIDDKIDAYADFFVQE